MIGLKRAGVLGLLLAACTGAPDPMHVTLTPQGGDTRLSLIASPELLINARVKPALELPDGRVLRFDAGSLTPDSAYFAVPPTTVLPGRHSRVRGTLRASVCSKGELVCRSLTVKL
jgi:hypothetical protein